MTDQAASAHDGRREFESVLVLSLCFGVVGLDRFIINPLFPVIARDLGLGYQDLGLISGALALTWGLAAIFSGQLADRFGLRATLLPAIIAFSVMVGLSGLATGLITLTAIRALMGFAEGAFVPGSIVATERASHPSRVGMNIGLQQAAAPLFGLGLAPILVTSLLNVVPSWHWVFALVAIPGFIMAFFLARVLPKQPVAPAAKSSQPRGQWRAALQHRNVLVNALCMVCWLSSFTTLAALLPSYFTDHLALSLEEMGVTLSAMGLGSVLGLVFLPALADRVGYKHTVVVATLVQVAALSWLSLAGADLALLFGLLAVIGFTSAGAIAITIGPLTGAAVPPALAATATGIVVGLGEICGGAGAPIASGFAAQYFGISVIPKIALALVCVGVLLTAFAARDIRIAASRAAQAVA